MKTKYKIGLVVIGLIVLIFVLNFMGTLSFLNHPLNKLVVGELDQSCDVDSDCVLKVVTCPAPCPPCLGEPVNKNEREAFCPFKLPKVACELCRPIAFRITCIEEQCQRVPIETPPE